MTVTTTVSTASYVGDGIVTDYAVPFPALQEGDLYVFVDDVLQTAGVDYSIVGDITKPNSTVSFTSPPGDTLAVFLQRQTGLTQLTEYTTYGEYKAEQHEDDFDKAMYIAQENRDIAGGQGGVLAPGLFQSSIDILNVDSGTFGTAQILYDSNIFNGGGLYFNLPDNGTYNSISWSLYDDSGNQRLMALVGDGTLSIPGAMVIDHRTQSAWGQYRTEYTQTLAVGPWIRSILEDNGDLTGLGLAVTWEFFDTTNTAQNLTLDPVTGGPVVSKQPDNSNPLSLATVEYVDQAIAAHIAALHP